MCSRTMPLGRTYMYNFGCRLLKGYCCMCDIMPLGMTYMYDSRKNAFKRAQVRFRKLPLKGLLMCARTIVFSSWMVVLS